MSKTKELLDSMFEAHYQSQFINLLYGSDDDRFSGTRDVVSSDEA